MSRPSKVFVCSTYLDNVDRRRRVESAIQRAEMVALGMERFTAQYDTTPEYCQRMAREADLLVGIIASRYGWIPPGYDVSITELEYDAQPTRLMFLLDTSKVGVRDQDWDYDYDSNPDKHNDYRKRLKSFKARINLDHSATLFEDDKDLELKVYHALVDWKQRADGSRLSPRRTLLVHGGSATPSATDSTPAQRPVTDLVRAIAGALTGDRVYYSPVNATLAQKLIGDSLLLTADAAVIVLENGLLESENLVPIARCLDWRRALGMPLVVVLTGGGAEERLKEIDFLVVPGRNAVIGVDAHVSTNVANALFSRMPGEADVCAQDPATAWMEDVRRILGRIPTPQMVSLARNLIPASVLRDVDVTRDILAAALFNADLDTTYAFLRDAERFLNAAVTAMDENDVPHGTRRLLVDRAIPIWVNLDTGREILNSAQLPPNRRMCGLRLSQLDWAQQAAERASAGAGQVYPSVVLSSVAGEHKVQELVDQHDRALRERLHVAPDATPKDIEERLSESGATVFAVLDSKGLAPKELASLLRQLRKRFPGITFLLVSDEEDDSAWRHHRIPIAINQLDRSAQRRIHTYLQAAKALVSKAKDGK